MDDLSMQAWTKRLVTVFQWPLNLDNMPNGPYTPTTYRKAFVERVRAARALAEKTPLEMAKLLNIPKDTYHRYETRTLLPHHLLEIFCALTGQDLQWLITGRHQRSSHLKTESLSSKKSA